MAMKEWREKVQMRKIQMRNCVQSYNRNETGTDEKLSI